MKTKKILSMLISAVMAVSATISTISVTVSAVDPSETFDDLNQSSITDAMQPGWNLGNQLEASNNGVPNETTWGNPVIRKELIHAVKLAGFKSIRIPISYLNKIGSAPNYTIDADWLARIKKVVDYCVDEGLYAIINMHGDGYTTVTDGWLMSTPESSGRTGVTPVPYTAEQQVEVNKKFGLVWQQIANTFKDYDEHLIFESMNEVFDGSYGDPNPTKYKQINDYNQIFVDTVRQTGGNNDKRWLLIPGWNTNINYTVDDKYGFTLPTDTNRNSSIPDDEQRIMVSVHYYDPWYFCGDRTDKDAPNITQWGKDADPNKKETSYDCDENFMEGQLKKVNEKFVSKGYPVVIGEYGCINKSAADPQNTKFRAYYDKTLCEFSKEYGCIPVYWDNGAIGNSFGLINRTTTKVVQQEIVDAIVDVFLTAKDKLNLAIIGTDDLEEKLYLPDSWQSFLTVLNSAKDVYNKAEASDSECLEAINNIKAAIAELKPDPSVLVETKLISEPQVSSSKNTQNDNLIHSISNELVDYSKLYYIQLTFTVNGDVTDDTFAFLLKPFSSSTWDGWDPDIIYFKDCTEENGVYTATINAQAVLATYSGKADKANGIDIHYGTDNPDITLTGLSALSAQGDRHVHSYTVVNKKENTCIERGFCELECKCDEEEGKKCTIYLDFGKHQYASATTTPATCTKNGIRTTTCSVCKDSYTTELPAKGHRYIDGKCKECGEKDPNYVPPTNPNNPHVTTPTSPKVPTTAPTTANAKKAAKAKVKNAKIKSLSVKSSAKKISVSWKKVNKVNGYQVQVAKKKNFKGKNIVLKKFTTKTKLTVKGSKIKKGKTYYVRVRTYATYKNSKNKPTKVYGKFGKTLRIKVK